MTLKFELLSPINVEETSQKRAIISGTLLVEGVSKNKNLYTINEMRTIARRCVGKPINFGTYVGISPRTGLWSKGLHDESESAKVGKIFKTAWDKVNRKIRYWGEVVNTEKFPDIISRIKKGWGVSVGGFVRKAHYAIDKLFGKVLQIRDMVVTHVQLVVPSITRGQREAQVEDVQIQECMIFSDDEGDILTQDEIAGYFGYKEGLINV